MGLVTGNGGDALDEVEDRLRRSAFLGQDGLGGDGAVLDGHNADVLDLRAGLCLPAAARCLGRAW